jgi:hypothetical protein
VEWWCVGAEVLGAGVDVGLVAGAGECDVGAFAGGVLGDDEMGRVGGGSLGGERMLDVRQSCLGTVELPAAKLDLSPVTERKVSGLGVRIDVRDGGGGAVAQRAELRVGDGGAKLDLVAAVESVGPAEERDGVRPEFAVLVADGLRAR